MNIRSIMKMCCYHIDITAQRIVLPTNCMQHVLSCKERQSGGTESKKTLLGRGIAPVPAWGAHSVPQIPSWHGGLAATAQKLQPALGPSGASLLLSPTPILVPTPLGSGLASSAPSVAPFGSSWRRR